jgi:ssDNA-binding Zn-finger/Zn-ribbon topoisomerase 1
VCELGQVVYRERGRHGPFLGCSAYPNCRAAWQVDGNRLPHMPAPSARRARLVLAGAVLLVLLVAIAAPDLLDWLRQLLQR